MNSKENETPEKMIETVKEKVKKAISKYIGEELVGDLKENIYKVIERQLKTLVVMNSDRISFEVVSDEKKNIEMVPNNFFTFLLMHCVFVPYSEVENCNSYKCPDNIPYFAGATFHFNKETREGSVELVKPVRSKLSSCGSNAVKAKK